MTTPAIDVQIENEGCVFMFHVLTDTAREWVNENVGLESWQWLGRAFSVEHRFAEDLASGMQEDGLNVA